MLTRSYIADGGIHPCVFRIPRIGYVIDDSSLLTRPALIRWYKSPMSTRAIAAKLALHSKMIAIGSII